MIKNYIVIIFTVISFGIVNSQTYKPFDIKNKQWNVELCTNVGGAAMPPKLQYDNVTYNICSDSTIINSVQYKPIYFKTQTYTNFPPLVNTTTAYSLYGYLRQDSVLKRSYLRLPAWNTDSLLLDYNLAVGDTIKRGFYFYSKPNFLQCNTALIIKKISVQNVGNNNLAKCFYTDTTGAMAYFIEGAGHSFGIFKNQTPYETYCEPFERCSHLWSVANSTNCISLVNNISKTEFTRSYLKVYPNPIDQTSFTISSDKQFNYYELVDVTGRVIQSKTIQATDEKEIDGSNLKAGYYFINTSLNGNSRSVLKIIVIR